MVEEWTIPSPASNDTYGSPFPFLYNLFSSLGLGWSLNIMGFNGWQHDGRMPGSAAMLVRLDNGLSMAVTVNKVIFHHLKSKLSFQEYSERDFFHELGYVLHHVGNNWEWWAGEDDLFQS